MNMNQASRGSRVVFVGNIPFELSEEQLIEVFKEVGPVASFRLLFDRDTGRPKGYGFCEFFDAETAASAVRNLNDYEIGGRQLRVDYAAMDDNQSRAGAGGGGGAGNQNFNQNQNRHQGGNMNMGGPPPPQQMQPPPMQMQQQQPMSMQQPMPMQQNMPMQQAPPPPVQQQQPVANLSSVDEISKVLASMSAQDLFTLMSQMKQMSHERPDFTKEFLASNPQVAYALFQAMIMMNIVDPNTITRIMSEQPIVQAAAPVQPVVVTPQMPVMQAPQPIRQPPPVVPQQQPMMNNPLPIPNQMSPQLPEDGPEQQKALLMRVLQLTDEQINALPPQARDQIRILKNQLTTQQQ